MKVSEIVGLVNAKVIIGTSLLDRDVEYAFASDLMSDVLTLDKENILLITGLSNPQAIRTAEMSDIPAIIIARNKKANPEMKRLAKENKMILMESSFSMFRIAGELYKAGVKPVF